jgi:hypothetical protein
MSPPRVETLHAVDGSWLYTAGSLFIQVRRGELGVDTFDRIIAALQRQRARMPRGAVHASIVLTEEGAPIPPEAVRIRQRAFVGEYLKDRNARLVAVVLGQTVDASLLRSASRGVVPSHPQLRVMSTIEEACAWLGAELGRAPAELVDAIAEARERARLAAAGKPG